MKRILGISFGILCVLSVVVFIAQAAMEMSAALKEETKQAKTLAQDISKKTWVIRKKSDCFKAGQPCFIKLLTVSANTESEMLVVSPEPGSHFNDFQALQDGEIATFLYREKSYVPNDSRLGKIAASNYLRPKPKDSAP